MSKHALEHDEGQFGDAAGQSCVSMVIPYRKALSKPPITAPNGLPDSIESGAERPAIPESYPQNTDHSDDEQSSA